MLADLVLYTNNQFSKVSILFTIIINLGSHASIKYEPFRAIWLYAGLVDKYF